MDGSNSRKSDAAATRKRRSSILKSQRAPRAPLSELEFNVATPQDTAKSRRVSFSRRTGVAEFEINEATTAWKNVYEEHNKSLETSANESGPKCAGAGGGAGAGARRRVAHLGGRAAQQFQDEEADELDADAPQHHELSAFTEHRTVQLFRLDTAPDMRELTDRLDLDFSAVAPLAADDLDVLQHDLEQDSRRADMSEISIDVDFNATHVSIKAEESGTDMSITDTIRSPRVASATEDKKPTDDWTADKENIAVNPYVAPPSAEFDVDGCDDILVFDGKKCKFQSNLDDEAEFEPLKDGRLTDDAAGDVSVPKRVVPPARPAPKDSTLGECDVSMTPAIPGTLNSEATNEHKTLFFDDFADITVTQAVPALTLQQGKPERGRTIVYDGYDGHVSMTEALPAQILPQKESERRKTIVYDKDDGHISMTEAVPAQILQQKESERRKTIVYGNEDGNLSVTEALPAQILPQKESERRKTVVYDKDDGHISMTEAVPAQILQQKESQRRKTIVYGNEDGNLSVTEALPAQILPQKESERRKTVVYDKDDGHISMTEAVPAQILQQKESERRKMIVYGNEDGNLSVTEALPAQILPQKESERRKTVVYDKDDGHISMTEAVPAQILQQKESQRRKTIVYGNEDGNLSVTEALPAQILPQKESERRKTVVYDKDDGHISMTEAVPAQILQQKESERRKTIVYGNEDGNLSVTEALPAQILPQKESERRKTVVYDKDDGHISMTEAVPAQILQQKESERRKTIVYGNEDGNLSVTEALPAQILPQEKSERRKTVVYDKDDGHISMTEAVPAQILQQKESERRKTIVHGNEDGNLSVTDALPAQILPQEKSERRKTVVYGNDDGHISMTEAVPAQILQQKEPERRKTIVYEKDGGNLSVTQAVPAQILQEKPSEKRRTIVYEDDDGHISMTETVPAQILQKESERRKTIVYENDEGNLSVTQAVPAQILQQKEPDRRKTIVFGNDGHISMTESIPAQILQQKEPERRKTVVYENDEADISVTQAVPAQIIPQNEPDQTVHGNDKSLILPADPVPAQLIQDSQRRRTIVYDNDEANLSVTEAIPAQILQEESERRKTITFSNDEGHISMTETVPAQILQQESQRRTIMCENDGHVSMTEAVPALILSQKDSSDNEDGHVSMTEAVPGQIQQQQESERLRTMIHDNVDISVTQAVPANIINSKNSKDNSVMRQGAPDPQVCSEMPDSVIERQQKVHFDNLMDMSIDIPVIQEESPRGSMIVQDNEYDNLGGIDKRITQPEQGKRTHENDGILSVSNELLANILVDEESKLAKPVTIKTKTSFESNSVNVSVIGVVASDIINEKADVTISNGNSGMNVVYEDDRGDISMTGVVLTDIDVKAEVNKQNESHRKPIVNEDNEGDVSMTGVVQGNISEIPSNNECNNENGTITQQKDSSQIIVYEDDDVQVSRSIHHTAPTIEPDEDSSINSAVEKMSFTLTKSPVDKVLVYEARADRLESTPSPQISPDGSMKAALPEPKTKSYSYLSPSINSRSPDRLSLGTISLRSALESASLLNSLCRSPRRMSVPPPPDRTSVLDALLDMSADDVTDKHSPVRSPDPTASDVTITNAPTSAGSYITIEDDAPSDAPALEPQPLALEYKKDKHGIVCKIQRRISELKDVIHYKAKSPKREKATSPARDAERGNQTLNESDAAHAGADDTRANISRANDTRALLDALTNLTDSRRSGDFARSPRARRPASLALDNRAVEARPTRKSMVRSREDLLKDISMAQALMKAQMEAEEEGSESEPEPEPVVRTLRFDDDEPSAVLRKPAAQPSPPRPARAVIPPYLHDVSDHVKELVEDLMKPMADVTPLRPPPERDARSAAAQASISQSSQIDLLPSPPVLVQPRSPVSCARGSFSPVVGERRLSEEFSIDSDMSSLKERVIVPQVRTSPAPRNDAVIVFDHENPLNNVLLPPIDDATVHKYEPPPLSDASLSPALDSRATQTDGRTDVECGVALVTPQRDRGVLAAAASAPAPPRRDTEVNTAIVMKANRDLLATSSSLTLVDDALTRHAFNVSVDSCAPARSPVRVIFKLEESYSSVKLDSELTSNAEESDSGKGQKRGRSPKRCTFAEDETPKPAVKVQKISNSSKVMRRLRSLTSTKHARDGSPDDADDARGSTHGSSSVTVQHLASECRLPGAPAPARSGSRGLQPECRRAPSESSASVRSGSHAWQPELLHELSSKDLVSECDPAVNVVAKIDVLPFMGTAECEWESRASDTWSFRLLRARLRLLVRLEHRSGNAARALVRADTPVRLVLVQHARTDTECGDPVASLCLCLTAAALQQLARDVGCAGAVPALLRRAAALARVALRWARAMHSAHRRLAFSLADDGLLSLKVANIPMRSVWEVTLRVELAEAGTACAWPRACDVRVTRVVAAWAPRDDALRRLLAPVPHDWGHVPRTVWKIFKYLKNRRPEDELLCV